MLDIKPVLFVHVPKTGGTTLWAAFKRACGRRRVRRIEEANTTENIQVLNQLIETGADRQYRLLGGHVFFDKTKLDNGYQFISMLRNPVERVISGYYHAVRDPNHRLYTEFRTEQVDLEEGLRRVTPNLQVRFLAGVPLDRESNEEDLAVAKYNLENHYTCFGLMERYHESLMWFKMTFGWKMPYYQMHNVGENKDRDIPDAIRTLAAELNPLDIDLYTFTCQLFEKKMAQQGIQHKLQVAYFERTLPLWQRWDLRRQNKP